MRGIIEASKVNEKLDLICPQPFKPWTIRQQYSISERIGKMSDKIYNKRLKFSNINAPRLQCKQS